MSEATTRTQPAAPVVGDEQIRVVMSLLKADNFCFDQSWPIRFARAILALRPAVEPMTPEQRDTAIDAKLAEYGYPANTRNAARAGWYACLQALGITAKADGDPNAKS